MHTLVLRPLFQHAPRKFGLIRPKVDADGPSREFGEIGSANVEPVWVSIGRLAIAFQKAPCVVYGRCQQPASNSVMRSGVRHQASAKRRAPHRLWCIESARPTEKTLGPRR